MNFNRCLLPGIFILFCHFSFAQKAIRKVNVGRYEEAEVISRQALRDLRVEDVSRDSMADPYEPHDYIKRMTPLHVLGLVQKFKGDFTGSERYFKKADSVYWKFKAAMRAKETSTSWMPTIRYSQFGVIFMNARQANRYFLRRTETARMAMKLGELTAAKLILDKMVGELYAAYGKKTSLGKSAYGAYGEYFQTTLDFDSSRYYYEKYIIELYSDPNYFDASIKRLSDAHQGLAEALVNLHHYDTALPVAKKAHKLSHHRFVKATDGKNYLGKIATANLVAETYRLKNDYERALRWNDKAFKLFNAHINIISPEKLPVLATRGQIFWALSDTVNAHKAFKELMDVFYSYTQNNFSYLSEPERAHFYRTNKHFVDLAKGYYYHLYFQKGYRENYIATALYEISLNNKGVLLNSSSKLLNEIYAKGDTTLVRDYLEIKTLREKKIQLVQKGGTNDVAEIDRKIHDQERALQRKLSLESDKFVSASEVLQAIPDDANLIDISKLKVFEVKDVKGQKQLIDINQSKYVFFVFDKQHGIQLSESEISDKDLEGRFYTAYLNVARNNITTDRVYHAFFDPFAAKLKHHQLIFSGDGIYNLVNPEILFDGQDFLINKYDFYSVVSAKDLVTKSHQKQNKISDITLIGFPDYATHLQRYDDKPADLPGTQTEIQGIAEQLPAHMDRHIYMRGDASESVVKGLPSSSVLHFATHGFFLNQAFKDPMHTTGLVLAIGDSSSRSNDDGFLTAYEASNLDLKGTHLVVLSACETGQGAFEEGEGVWGLQRAFQVAGVRYIIMSLFKVEDDVTSLLMQEFYANMIEGKPVVEAFHEAQLQVKKKYTSPVQWGAFVVKGI
jgi:CHAT domain-containing protein